MPLYIHHYATIDAEGHLSIDCQGPFPTKEDARQQQTALITAFQTTHSPHSPHEIQEHHGTFHRIAYAGLLTELQSHIEELVVKTSTENY